MRNSRGGFSSIPLEEGEADVAIDDMLNGVLGIKYSEC